MEYLSIMQAAITITVGVLVYILNRSLREDAWARTLRDFHQFFWTDVDCKEVRSWIACDSAYTNKVYEVLAKRENNKNLTEDEYKIIEKIDKFFALLMSYKQIERKHTIHSEVSKRLFDSYWIEKIRNDENRQELFWYMEKFYPELIFYLENPPVGGFEKTKKIVNEKISLFARLIRLTA